MAPAFLRGAVRGQSNESAPARMPVPLVGIHAGPGGPARTRGSAHWCFVQDYELFVSQRLDRIDPRAALGCSPPDRPPGHHHVATVKTNGSFALTPNNWDATNRLRASADATPIKAPNDH